MLRIVIIFFILNVYSPVLSSIKEKIIAQMQNTDNLNFNFIQTVDGREKTGKCIIEYPKKIFCEYNGVVDRIIVSNGKALVIKNRSSGNYHYYKLNETPLEYLLDKKYLISKIKKQEPREIDNKYLNFKIFENNNEINIFFDKKNLNLIGWQTEDMFQKLTITFISMISRNQIINKDIFKLPSRGLSPK